MRPVKRPPHNQRGSRVCCAGGAHARARKRVPPRRPAHSQRGSRVCCAGGADARVRKHVPARVARVLCRLRRCTRPHARAAHLAAGDDGDSSARALACAAPPKSLGAPAHILARRPTRCPTSPAPAGAQGSARRLATPAAAIRPPCRPLLEGLSTLPLLKTR